MRLIIEPTPNEMANWAANYVADRINAFKPTPERPFILGLPTGSTPIKTYKKLIELYKAKKVSFENV
ncbi:MAG: glucosamine-6-phosphate deaminase, partial [Bacteroidales bacterium]